MKYIIHGMLISLLTLSASAKSTNRNPASIEALAEAEIVIDPSLTPQVYPDTLVLNGATRIRIHLSAMARKKYKFSQKGEAIKFRSGENNFLISDRPSDGELLIINRYQSLGDFKYDVNLTDKKTGEPILIDPVIRNEG